METAGFKVKSKWCRRIGEEVEIREPLKLFTDKAGRRGNDLECLHADRCEGKPCRWTIGGEDPLVNIEEEFEE